MEIQTKIRSNNTDFSILLIRSLEVGGFRVNSDSQCNYYERPRHILSFYSSVLRAWVILYM